MWQWLASPEVTMTHGDMLLFSVALTVANVMLGWQAYREAHRR